MAEASFGLLSAALLLSAARATTYSCPELEVTTAPGPDEVVPAGVLFTVVLENLYVGCDEPRLWLESDQGVVPTSLEDPTWGVYRVRPTSPLELGRSYSLVVSDEYSQTETRVPVTVGEPAPPSPELPAASIGVERQCRSGWMDVSVVAETSAPVTGVLLVDYQVDGSPSATRYVTAREQTRTIDQSSLWDGDEVCATLRFEDLAGAEVWRVEPICADEPPCPTVGPPEAVTFTMEPVCDGDTPATRIVADIDLPVAPEGAWGRLEMGVTTSLGSQGVVWRGTLPRPGDDPHVDVTVLGGHEVCFELVLRTASGEEVWRDGPHCAEEAVTCPEDEGDPPPPTSPNQDVDGAGCGCAAGPRSPPVLVAWLSVLAVRRRSGARPQAQLDERRESS